MSSTRARKLGYFVFVVGTLLGAYVILISGPETQPKEQTNPPKRVRILEVRPENARIFVTAHGSIVPAREVTLEPQVSGRIIRLHPDLRPGGLLQKGEELFAIDPTLMDLERRQSLAMVNRAEIDLKEARRLESEGQALVDDKVISTTKMAALQSAVAVSLAELERLKALLERAEELLRRHVVRAPFNAIVLEESLEIGQRVEPGYHAATLVGKDDFWIKVTLPVEKLKWLKFPRGRDPGSKVDVFWDTGDEHGEHFVGQVIQRLPDLERWGRMARVLVNVANPLGLDESEGRTPLLLGGYVRTEIEAGELEDVVVIERSKLRRNDTVWVVDAAGEVQIRDVQVLWRDQERIYLKNNWLPTDLLIVSELRVAIPGMKVISEPARTNSQADHGSVTSILP